MTIKPKHDYRMPGTRLQLSKARVYEAEPATNLPDHLARALVFADVDGYGFLLERGEYTVVSF